MERLLAWLCICVWLDAVHRTDSRHSACAGGSERDDFPRSAAACCIFCGACNSISANGGLHCGVVFVFFCVPQIFFCPVRVLWVRGAFFWVVCFFDAAYLAS